MRPETIAQLLAIHQEIECLEQVKKKIENTRKFRLSYLEYHQDALLDVGEWRIVDLNVMKFVGDILDRHDLQVRQEIDDRIEKLKKNWRNYDR